MLDNKKEVQQFLNLHSKSTLELRALCEGIGIQRVPKDRTKIINLLVFSQKSSRIQKRVDKPHLIPLRSTTSDGKPIPRASELFKAWRKKIYEIRRASKFKIFDSTGKQRNFSMKCIPCDSLMLTSILELDLLSNTSDYRDLVGHIRTTPELFQFSIVLKPDKRGNNWIMLHLQPRTEKESIGS